MIGRGIRLAVVVALASTGGICAAHSADAVGATQKLAVHQSLTATTGIDGRTTFVLTKTVGLPYNGADMVRPDNNSGGCSEDGGLRVQACNSVTYNAYTSGGFRFASIQSVNVQATILDRSATLSDLDYDIYATGACGQGCTGVPHHEYAGNITKPSSGVNYPKNSTWYGQYQRLSENPFDIQGNHLTLHYAFRGTTNTLTDNVSLSNS